MSENQAILLDTADRLFSRLAEAEDPLERAWAAVEEVGLPSLLVPEEQGGFGGDWQDAFTVLRLAGYHALAAPVAEAVIAAFACAKAGLEPSDGLLTLAERLVGAPEGGRFSGVLSGVPFGSDCRYVIGAAPAGVFRVRTAEAVSQQRRLNPAGEPRDVLRFEGAAAEVGKPLDLVALGALVRSAQIAGALDAALALSIGYANERVQFGRAIGKFQAIQQALAVFAEEAAAANCAAEAAARAADAGDAMFEIAAAKLRSGRAAEVGAAIAHQTHGAIGFTCEHPLHRFTRRLLSWRSEFGGDRFWAGRLAAWVSNAGADGLWPMITARSDVRQGVSE